MTVYILPIEPLEERYSEQWYRWFPEAFARRGVRRRVIDGETLTDTVEVGTFLDVNSTLAYKASQLQVVAGLFHRREIQDGDAFFVADVEFWGIEAIRYLADLNGLKNIRIFGFAHAGSYTTEDFFSRCAEYAQVYEHGWGKVFDKIFVGSTYHQKKLARNRNIPIEKIVVTGNPYDVAGVRQSIRRAACSRPMVIHTNRPDPEKRPEDTLRVFEVLHELHPDWLFAVTTSRKVWGYEKVRQQARRLQDEWGLMVMEGLTKQEYLNMLAEATVMTGNTIEENFGYCVLESLIANTIPVVPNNYSHPELVCSDSRCLFNSMDEQIEKIETAMANPFPVTHYADRFQGSLDLIVDLVSIGESCTE